MGKMILTEQIQSTALDYIKESVEGKAKNCLGRLKGVCADFLNPTRNGRKYSKALWEKVISSDTFKEYLDTKTLFGELNHPADRLETDIKEIAISLADIQFENNGTLVATFDILDTPNGRILKSLCDYGSKLGVSSRGGGDVVYRDGENYVDEDTYEFVAFDIVGLPAVKAARPSVIESVEYKNKVKTLKESVLEEIDKATSKSELLSVKRIIEGVELPDKENIMSSLDNKLDSLAGDTIPAKLLEDFNSSIAENEKLKNEIATLKESISAGTTREMKLKEENEKLKSASQILGDKAKKTAVLERMLQVRGKQPKANPLTEENETLTARNKALMTEAKVSKENNELLLNEKTAIEGKYRRALQENNGLKGQVNQLTEALENRSKEFLQKAEVLKSQLESVRKDADKKIAESTQKVAESKRKEDATLNEFKKLSEMFIATHCKYNGLDENLIKGQLGNNYSISNIERLLKEALDYKVRIGSLPFELSGSRVRAQVISEDRSFEQPKRSNPDDDDLSGAYKMLSNINK